MNARIRLLAAVASLVLVAACGSATTVRLTPYAVGATSGTLPSATPSVSPVASSSSSSPPTATPSSPSAPTMAALLDTTHGWAVVGGRLLVTSDGGMTWTDRTPAVGGAGMAGLLGVSFLDPGHGWIALDEPFTSAADASYGRVDVWRTADGGLTWERSELPKAAVNHFGEIMPGVQFDFLDAMHGFAVISGGAASGRGGSDLYWTADGGATWSADRPTGGASGLSGLVAFADANDSVMAGGTIGSGFFMTHNGGLTWSGVPLASPPGFAGAQPFVGQPRFFGRVGIVPVLYQTGSGDHAIRVFRSVDGGATWASASTLSANGIALVVDASHWVVVPWTSSAVLHTADGGAIWTRTTMTAPLTLHTDAVSFTNPTTGWALAGDPGSTTLMVTSDGGASWHALTPAVSAPEPAGSSAPSGAPQAAPACTTVQLQISTVNTGAAAGTVGGWLRFHNMATQACFLRGWPTVVGVTVSGATVQARYVDMLLDSPNVQGTPTVILEPGEDAFAAFVSGDNPVGSAMTCPPSFTTLRVTPPGATGFGSVSAWNVGLGADLRDCAGLEVTMVVPRSLVPYVPLTP